MTTVKQREKSSRGLKAVIILSLIVAFFGTVVFLAYGPIPTFRDLWITSAMTTMNHKYLATWFFSDEMIRASLDRNRVVEPEGETDASLIESSGIAGDGVEMIPINKLGFKAYLLKVKDPSKVELATTNRLLQAGQLLTDIAEGENAVAAINAGGFYDPDGMGNGGTPTGLVVKDGEVLFDSGAETYNIIGFNENHVLVLGRYTVAQLQEKGILDAVNFEPFLILNGEPAIVKGNGGWGVAPRTAIGQTRDGTVLFLIVDGRQASSVGASLKDVMDIMLEYGAVNAANLDGGSSSALYLNGEIVSSPCAATANGLRRIPTAFVVKR